MPERVPRLGDVVDDYCPRCRLLLNHDVASLYQGQVAKVTCRTCYNTHDYRHAQVPPKRSKGKESEKKKLMDQVLAGLGRTPEPEPAGPGQTPEPPAPPPPSSSAGPAARKRRDLWAEYERIKGQKKD